MPLTSAQQLLVIANLRIAQIVARKARRKSRRSMDSDSLLSSAMLGLCNAALLFDAARGLKFVTYASQVCSNQIAQDLQLSRLIHIPRYLQQRANINHWLRPDALRAMAITHWVTADLDALEWPTA